MSIQDIIIAEVIRDGKRVAKHWEDEEDKNE